MKKRNYIFLLLLPLFVYFFSTCKKYPEDKFISLRTVKARLEGEWKIDRIEVNQEDVTYKYKDSLPMPITDYYFWFRCNYQYGNSPKEKEDVFAINKSSKRLEDAMKNVDVGGVEFYMERKKKELGFAGENKRIRIKDSLAFKVIFRNLIIGYHLGWEIRSLSKNKLIIERTERGNDARIYLNKTRNR